jgi:hypothetical protein
MYEENEKSIFNYNMLFNKINSDNLDENIDYNTNLISDINLQNFDIKRYEYYTNLLYIYNKDPATLYNLLKKYYNIKNFKSKERKIIKHISNYARLLKDSEGIGSPIADKLVNQQQGGADDADKAELGQKAVPEPVPEPKPKAELGPKAEPKDKPLGKYDKLYDKLKEGLPQKKTASKIIKSYVEKGNPSKREPSPSKGEPSEKVKPQNNEQQKKKLKNLLKLLEEAKLKDVDSIDKIKKKSNVNKQSSVRTSTSTSTLKEEQGNKTQSSSSVIKSKSTSKSNLEEDEQQSSEKLVQIAIKLVKNLLSKLQEDTPPKQQVEIPPEQEAKKFVDVLSSSLSSAQNKDELTAEQSNIRNLLDKTLQIAIKTLKNLSKPEVKEVEEEGDLGEGEGEEDLKELDLGEGEELGEEDLKDLDLGEGEELGEEELEEELKEELGEDLEELVEKEESQLLSREILPLTEQEKTDLLKELDALNEEAKEKSKLKDKLEIQLLKDIFTFLSKPTSVSSVKYTFTDDNSINIITFLNILNNNEICKIMYTNLVGFVNQFIKLINILNRLINSRNDQEERFKRFKPFFLKNNENFIHIKYFFDLSQYIKKHESNDVVKKFYFIHHVGLELYL